MAGLSMFSQPAQAAMTGKKFTILVITDLSTVFSDTSGQGSVDGVKMAVEDFGGSVNGVPINVVVLDNKLDVALTINKTREIIDSQGVNLITDVPVRRRHRGRKARQRAQDHHDLRQPRHDGSDQRGVQQVHLALRLGHDRDGDSGRQRDR